jgi:hypothetical protein
MYAAAADLEAGGIVAQLFDGVPAPPGSVPQLRLLAALHHLVLAGQAPALAEYYPSAGGQAAPDDIWPVARGVLESRFDSVGERLHVPVQTNEPGRSAVLFSALIWLADQHRRPVRLLEIGASAGLNLMPDRYCYLVSGDPLGDPSSPVRFEEPWQPGPEIDLVAAAAELEIVARAGCDRHPLDPSDEDDQLTLMSYIWPDETDRIGRMRAALLLASESSVPVIEQPASEWLPAALAAAGEDELTVIWQSVVRQYIDEHEWQSIEEAVRATAQTPLVWLAMEPGDDHLAGMRLTSRSQPVEEWRLLASCGDHGPPVVWIRCGDAR